MLIGLWLILKPDCRSWRAPMAPDAADDAVNKRLDHCGKAVPMTMATAVDDVAAHQKIPTLDHVLSSLLERVTRRSLRRCHPGSFP
jgi:hypothetical protein